MKQSLMNRAAGAFCGLAMLASAAPASAQTQTSQSAMVNLTPDSLSYEIAGTITWKFERGNQNDVDLTGKAMSYYTNMWDGVVPTPTCSGGGSNGCVTAPATPLAPAPSA